MSASITTNKTNFKLLVWFFFVVFFIHNTEEFFTASNWIRENINILPLFIRIGITNYLANDFSTFYFIALILATLLPLIICIWINTTKYKNLSLFLMIIIICVTLLNALQHLSNTLIFQKYTPGLLTGVLINLPFCVYFLIQLKKEKRISYKKLLLYIPIGLLVYFLSLMIIFIISYNVLILIKQ